MRQKIFKSLFWKFHNFSFLFPQIYSFLVSISCFLVFLAPHWRLLSCIVTFFPYIFILFFSPCSQSFSLLFILFLSPTTFSFYFIHLLILTHHTESHTSEIITTSRSTNLMKWASPDHSLEFIWLLGNSLESTPKGIVLFASSFNSLDPPVTCGFFSSHSILLILFFSSLVPLLSTLSFFFHLVFFISFSFFSSRGLCK